MTKPILMFAWLDGHVRQWTDSGLEWFAERLSEAGIDYVRLLPTWQDNRAGYDMPQPYLRQDLRVPNYKYSLRLSEFCRIMHEGGIKVAMDAMDNCAAGYPWDTWSHNQNGVYGIYDTSRALYDHLIAHIDRVRNCGVDLIGLGNELTYPFDGGRVDLRGLHHWTESIILPMARYLLQRQPFVYYSADNTIAGTANKIRAYLTEPDYGNLPRHKVIEVIHGLGTPAHWRAVHESNTLSVAVSLGMSDDGVGIGSQTLRPEERGRCEESNLRCKATQALRLATVQAMERDLGDQFRLVEFLAPEIAMAWTSPAELDEDYSVETYRKVLGYYGVPLPPRITYEYLGFCTETSLRATPYCPAVTLRRYRSGRGPTELCPVHKKPGDDDTKPDDNPPVPEPDPVPPSPAPLSCWTQYMGPKVNLWQPLKWIKCVLGRKG